MTAENLVLPTDLTFEEALEVTEAISQGLGSMADVYEAVVPFIHKSFAGRAWKTLGHQSPSEYVTKYFGDQLSRLGVDMRQDIVRELTAARISAREQAEILGVGHQTILRDQKTTGPNGPVERPETVISRDGRERPASVPHDLPKAPTPEITEEDRRVLERQAADARRWLRTAEAVVTLWSISGPWMDGFDEANLTDPIFTDTWNTDFLSQARDNLEQLIEWSKNR